jgi:hypothetical protein
MPDVPVTDRINYVDGAIQSLDKETARIVAFAKDLLLRLKPVMRMDTLANKDTLSGSAESARRLPELSQKDQVTTVPLADKIASETRILSEAADILNGIMDRLEI